MEDTTLRELLEMQQDLMSKIPHGHMIPPELIPRVVAGLGIIEETLEYLNTLGVKSWRPYPLPKPKQIEELVDGLFFHLEMMIFSEFTIEEIVAEYKRKHAVNLDRYKRAKCGDWSWDDRGKGEL